MTSAQESKNIPDIISDNVENDISNKTLVSLYIPEHMILGETYFGMVSIVNHDDQYQIIEIAANQDAVTVPNSVPILPHEDHAKFKIISKHAGSFTISVKFDGVTLKQTVFVTDSKNSSQNLLLIIPEKTKTENLIGAIYLVDSIYNPIIASEEILINLQGSTGITVPETITILQGNTGASFEIHARATGSISASSRTMYDSADISYETKKPKVMMDVFPKIMQENSFGYYFLWFESDEMPYIPHIPTSATIHSSNSDIARMELAISAEKRSSIKETFFDGVTYGRIFTGNPGLASVTGTIPGFGSATSEFLVGPATIGEITITNNTAITSTQSINAKPIDIPKGEVFSANTLFFDIIPPTTLSESYIVAGLYHAITDETITIDEDNIETLKVVTDLYPIYADERDIYISSNGAEHLDVVRLENVDIPTHVNLYDIGGNVGEYEISASAAQVESRNQIEFSIVADESEIYSIGIIPLPIISEHIQDVALLYIADSDGAVIDPKKIWGSGITIHLKSEYVLFSENSIHLNEPVSLIRGAPLDVMDTGITALANGLADVTVSVGTLMVNEDSVVIIHTPETIHSGEEFTVAAHVMQDGKATLQITEQIQASGGCSEIKYSLFSCDGPGSLSIFSDYGEYDVMVIPYRTLLDVTINHPFDEPLSVGKKYSIPITSARENITINVDTAINYEINKKIITLTPGTVGNFDVSIIISSPGKENYIKSYNVTVDNLIDISVLAKDEAGNSLGFNVTITGTGNYTNQMTDYTNTIPRQSVTVSYPDTARHGSFGYELINIKVDDGITKKILEKNTITINPENDHIILGTYKQVFLIDVIGGTGSGVYEFGDIVSVSAPEKYTMAFLIREVLDRWEGIDTRDSSVEFTAKEDLSIVAVYRTDYTGAVVVFVICGSIITILAFKQNHSYYLRISQILDFISSQRKFISGKKRSKVDKTKSEGMDEGMDNGMDNDMNKEKTK